MAEYKVISEFVDKKTNKRVKVGEIIELSNKQAKQALKASVVEEIESDKNNGDERGKDEGTSDKKPNEEVEKDKSTKNKG